MQDQFEKLVTSLGNITVSFSKKVLDVDDNGQGVTLTYLDLAPDARKNPEDRSETDLEYVRTIEGSKAILAIGFGRELRYRDIPGYWDGDGLTSIETKPLSWLVSGHGDGALTDLIRLMVKDFDHGRIVTKVTSTPEFTEDLKQQLLQSQSVRQAFDGLAPIPVAGLLKELGELRHDTNVTFCAPRDTYLESAESCVFNRLLVFLLEDRLRFIEGKIREIPVLNRAVPHPYLIEFVGPVGSRSRSRAAHEF